MQAEELTDEQLEQAMKQAGIESEELSDAQWEQVDSADNEPEDYLEELERLSELEGEFDTARSQFLRSYADERGHALSEWRETASLLAADPEALMAAIEGSFPTADKLEAKFGFETHLFQVALPQNLSKELVTAGEQQEVIAARRAAARQATHPSK